MKRRIQITLLLSLFFSLLSIAHADSPYRIGVILPLSGPLAYYGISVKRGILLAQETEQKLTGNIPTLIWEDDGFEAKKSVAAYHKLHSVDKVDAVLALGSTAGNALAPLAERDQIPLIVIGASDGKIASGRKFVFVHWVSSKAEARSFAAEIQKRGYQHIALAVAEQEGSIAIEKSIKAELERLGIAKSIVLCERFLSSETDYRGFLTSARQKKVELIGVLLFPDGITNLARQHAELKIEAELAGLELFEDPSTQEAAGGTLDGRWYVSNSTPKSEFVMLHKTNYSTEPGWGSSNAYDSLRLLVQARREVGNDRKAIANWLTKLTNYQGASGTYSATGNQQFTLSAGVHIIPKK